MKNITIKINLSILVLLSFVACSQQVKERKQPDLQEQFTNVLNIQGIPQEQFELEPFGFSDLGAWHGYALPHQDSTAYYGGFSGPLTMKMWGQWLGKNLCQLQLTDAATMEPIDLSKAKAEMVYKPGMLQQTLELPDWKINICLVFASNRSSLIETKISNKKKQTQACLLVGKAPFSTKNYN